MRYPIWILCQVVDNFGDAGVCWRLAKDLAAGPHFEPTLIIDQPETLAQIEPRLGRSRTTAADRASAGTVLDGVRVIARPALEAVSRAAPPAVIVSAFGCEPPAWLRRQLAGGPPRPLWLQLEYLSAEPWVEDCHGLVSIKPSDAAREHFLYPGFTDRTAGLLRERTVFERRDAFRAVGQPGAFLSRLGAAPRPDQRVFSLFCYPSAPLERWFESLAAGPASTLVCVAGGSAQAALRAVLGDDLAVGDRGSLGHVEFVRLPMLDQEGYDQLLWSCAFNAVRGEDSWLRAHWAGTPFIWQAYPQAESVHLRKLEAFLDRMRASSPSLAADHARIADLMRAWNRADSDAIGTAWQAFDARLRASDAIGEPYRRWVASLAVQTPLTERLTQYCLDRLE
jgi:uncharacterized repeat protein (TIGR03837 family)